MTTFNQKFSELVKVTQSEQQQLQDETDINEYILEMEESVKTSFKIIMLSQKNI